MKKISIIMTVFTLCISLAFPVFAENGISSLWNAVYDLAFETENASLTGTADFYLDGNRFKTFTVTCMQEEHNSWLSVDTETPRHDGTMEKSGYRVLGKEGKAYYWDRSETEYYSEIASHTGTTVISSPAVRTASRLIDSMLDAADVSTAGVTHRYSDDGSSEYIISLSEDDHPPLLQQSVFPVLTGILESCGYPFFHFMPEEIQACLSEEQMPEEALNILIHAYGKSESFLGSENIRIAERMMNNVFFTDRYAAFPAYYSMRTGSKPDPFLSEAVLSQQYPGLLQAYYQMLEIDMPVRYLKIAEQDENAVGIRVYENAEYELLFTPEDVVAAIYSLTPADRIRWFTQDIDISSAEVRIDADTQGRIVSANGEITLDLTYTNGDRHTVKTVLSCTAGKFGTTRVSDITPESFGLVSSDIGSEKRPGQMRTASDPELPETVVFDGKEYRKIKKTPIPESYQTEDPVQPAVTCTPKIPGDTVVYYNPNGGRSYHLRKDCPTMSDNVSKTLLSVTWTELLADRDGTFSGLKPCPKCGAPDRP